MPAINTLLAQLKRRFQYNFTPGDDFKWSGTTQTISHPPINTERKMWSLLHEIAHGELGHATFDTDISLIEMEVSAWQLAKAIASSYNLTIDEDYIQDHLDSYRLWLHKRSQCPQCGQNGIQTKTKIYSCIHCRFLWRANEARICNLRRMTAQV